MAEENKETNCLKEVGVSDFYASGFPNFLRYLLECQLSLVLMFPFQYPNTVIS